MRERGGLDVPLLTAPYRHACRPFSVGWDTSSLFRTASPSSLPRRHASSAEHADAVTAFRTKTATTIAILSTGATLGMRCRACRRAFPSREALLAHVSDADAFGACSALLEAFVQGGTATPQALLGVMDDEEAEKVAGPAFPGTFVAEKGESGISTRNSKEGVGEETT